MTCFQLELIILTVSSFSVGVLIGLLIAHTFQSAPRQTRKNNSAKCPWCGKFKRQNKMCKCEE